MLYNSLKIIHIISATLLLVSMIVSFRLWKLSTDTKSVFPHIQIHTVLVFIPFVILQLATGFTMISLKHYALSELWITGSIIGFIIVITSWIAFVYLLLASHQARRTQASMLILCAIALLSMIFFMANKII